MENLRNIRIVLVETTHSGNIGAAARAMKVMGLDSLHLVAPKKFPSREATALASSADDILADAVMHETLDSALEGCSLVLGTSARLRALSMAQLDPRACAARAVNESRQHPVAILFGRERNGLDNSAIQRCHYLINIPTSEEYMSLNLAQAVQVVCYEIYLASLDEHVSERPSLDWAPESDERMEVFFQRLDQTLREIGFLNPEQPKRLMQRLRRLFNRARPDENELNILNGILSAASDAARRRND